MKIAYLSLKRVALDDGVKIGLSKELEGILSSRLVSMGISPEWNGLPKESFNKALTLVKHQASLTRKVLLMSTKRNGMFLLIYYFFFRNYRSTTKLKKLF